jgi:hypothetical protein
MVSRSAHLALIADYGKRTLIFTDLGVMKYCGRKGMVGGEEGGGVASSVLCVEGSVRGTKTERKFHENFASARRQKKQCCAAN